MNTTMRLVGLVIILGVFASTQTGCSSHKSAAVVESAPIADPGFLEQYAATYRFRAGVPTSITPTPQNDAVLFLRSGPRSVVRDLYSYDVATGEECVLLTADQILQGETEVLTAEEKARRERMRLSARGIATYSLSEDGTQILVPLSGDLYVVDRMTGSVRTLSSDAGYPIDPQFSPDASMIGVVRDNDLFVMDVSTGAEARLTQREHDAISYGVSEFVAQEEMSRHHGFWWSPDGERIAFQRTDESDVEVLRIMDPTRPENPPQAWRYPRPGKTNATVELGIMRVPALNTTGDMTVPPTSETIWVQWDREQYPYLATVKWSKHGPLTILVQNRKQTEAVLLAVDEETGYTTPLLIEFDTAWVNLDQDMPVWMPDDAGFLWTTERNGAWQLEHRNPDGSLARTLTPVDFGYRGFVHFQEETGDVIVTAGGGIGPQSIGLTPESSMTSFDGEAPATMVAHGWRVPLDATRGGPSQRTTAPGMHSAKFADKGALHVHSYQTMSGERGWDVLGQGGEKLGELTSVAEEPSFDVNIEFTTVRSGRVFDAYIIRPRDFVAGQKYPVIVSVYGGPHSKTVVATPDRYVFQQWIADHGFIVVQIDGRGTPNRGRAWERAIKNDLISTALPDQVAALTALCERYPELDKERVGIYGWSFGGYFAAHAVMQRPDIFHAGVAGAPVADWADYDTHYTERYMGLPEENASGYEQASVLTHAPKLERPLLIIHGTADDNVYFMHSLKMTEALFLAGKDFDFIPLAGFTHMVPDPLVTNRLYTAIIEFFNENLKD